MDQFNVLIVDDEIHAVKGVVAGIDWNKLGVTNVYTAHSFQQAQTIFQGESIDLLLSDIDMPHGSGIDLLTWVRQNEIDVEAIFLTCHSEFSYAKEALQLNSLNYLLKPIDYIELENAIKDAFVKIKQDKQVEEVKISFNQLKKMQQIHLREQFWLALVNESVVSTKDEIKPILEKFQLTYDEKNLFLPILIHVSRNVLDNEENASSFFLKSAIFETITDSNVNATIVRLQANYTLVMIPKEAELSQKTLLKNCQLFIEKCRNNFGFNVCCYIGENAPITEVVQIVNQLREIDKNNVTEENTVFSLNENNPTSVFIPTLPKERWIAMIRTGAKEELIEDVQKCIDSWEQETLPITWQTLHRFYQDFLQVVYYTLQRKELEVSQVFSKELFEGREVILGSVKLLKRWVLLVIDVLMDQIHDQESGQTVVDKVKSYIKENITEHQLSRDEIANYVYFNPDYLARIFKKETGISVSEFIIQERIKLAGKLLRTTSLPISDIALDCGYSNFSYFSTLFKKINDMTPNEYRKKYQK